jgi:hypothetical protein
LDGLLHVRFPPDSDQAADIAGDPFGANSGPFTLPSTKAIIKVLYKVGKW